MAKIDGQVDLVVLRDVKDVLLVLHVNSHELVADFWGVLCVIDQTKLLVLDVHLELWIVFQAYALTFDLLAPAILVEALPEEDHVGQHNFVVELVYSDAHAVQVQGKDLVHQHFLAILGAQVVIISLPFRWLRGGRQVVVRGHLDVVSLHASGVVALAVLVDAVVHQLLGHFLLRTIDLISILVVVLIVSTLVG